MSPRLSVLLPCRDTQATLPEAIGSLRAQTFGDFEVIAIDDGSTDGTGAALAAWAEGDPRVSVIDSPAGARQGIVPALDRAATVARAPLLARMDADDIAHPRRFEAQITHLDAHPGLAGCGTHVELFSRGGIRSGYRRYEGWINAIETPVDVSRAALIECPIAHPTLVLKASVFRALGGYRDMGWAEDHDLILRVLAAGAALANVPGEPLLRWRIRENRLSLTSPAYTADAFRRCRVHFLREVFLPPVREVVIWGAGRVGKPLARELIRQGNPVAAFVDLDARKIGQEIHDAPVLSFEEFAARARTTPRDRRPYVLAAVGTPGARHAIRRALAGYDFEEIRDFRFCA